MEYMNLKRADLTKLAGDGYLEEANRQFFHPLGKHLSVEGNDGFLYLTVYEVDDENGLFYTYLDPEIVADIWEKQLKAREIRSTLPFCNGDGIQDEDMD